MWMPGWWRSRPHTDHCSSRRDTSSIGPTAQVSALSVCFIVSIPENAYGDGLMLPKSGEIYAQELVAGDCLYVHHEVLPFSLKV